jgi:integrase
MSPLRQALADYLAVRRVLGYRLVRAEKLLAQFLTYVEARGEDHLTTATALAWATLSPGAHRSWVSTRLSIVRRFAVHLQGIDPATEVPARDLLPGQTCRATPYLYSDADIAALIAVADSLRTPHRVATYRTLIALLAVTGMRIGEAIGLDTGDFDRANGVLTIRHGKFGKSREVPLHPSTVTALGAYLGRGDRPRKASQSPTLFVSMAGTRLLYTNVQPTFHKLVGQAGLMPRSAACRPRLHDIRHNSGSRIIPRMGREGAGFGEFLAD